jgi:hypothetical protein
MSMRHRLVMTIGMGLLALHARGARAGELTYSLGVTPLAQVAPTEATPARADDVDRSGFFGRLFRAYYDSFNPPATSEAEAEPPRRALPAPFDSPPFPSSEYQGIHSSVFRTARRRPPS